VLDLQRARVGGRRDDHASVRACSCAQSL